MNKGSPFDDYMPLRCLCRSMPSKIVFFRFQIVKNCFFTEIWCSYLQLCVPLNLWKNLCNRKSTSGEARLYLSLLSDESQSVYLACSNIDSLFFLHSLFNLSSLKHLELLYTNRVLDISSIQYNTTKQLSGLGDLSWFQCLEC